MQQLTTAQRGAAQACAEAWLDQQIAARLITAMPVLTEDEDEARQAADVLVIPVPDGADPLRALEDAVRDRWPDDRAFLIADEDVTFPGEPG